MINQEKNRMVSKKLEEAGIHGYESTRYLFIAILWVIIQIYLFSLRRAVIIELIQEIRRVSAKNFL